VIAQRRLDRLAQRRRRRRPPHRGAIERAGQHVGQRRRDRRRDRLDPRDRLVEHRRRGQRRRAAREQRPAGQRLPGDHAQREQIGAAIDRAAGQLLGRHVRELALHDALIGGGRRVVGLGDAEVEQLDHAVGGDEDVARRHVAVHDAERRAGVVGQLVRVIEPVARLHQQPGHDPRLGGVGRGGARAGADHRGQRHALEVRHHQVVLVADVLEVGHLAHVGWVSRAARRASSKNIAR
jgi:hypothetical protein